MKRSISSHHSGSLSAVTCPRPSNTRDRPALADTMNAAADCARKTVVLLDSTKFKADSLMTAQARSRWT